MKLLLALIVAMMVTLTGCDSPSLSEDEAISIVKHNLSALEYRASEYSLKSLLRKAMAKDNLRFTCLDELSFNISNSGRKTPYLWTQWVAEYEENGIWDVFFYYVSSYDWDEHPDTRLIDGEHIHDSYKAVKNQADKLWGQLWEQSEWKAPEIRWPTSRYDERTRWIDAQPEYKALVKRKEELGELMKSPGEMAGITDEEITALFKAGPPFPEWMNVTGTGERASDYHWKVSEKTLLPMWVTNHGISDCDF